MSHAVDARRLTTIARELHRETSEPVTTKAILQNALRVLPGADMASLTVRSRKHTYRTLSSTDRVAELLDESQYALGEGPCVSTADGGDWLSSSDLATDSRWPRWGPVAVRKGVHGILSVRLDSKGEPFGALNLYSTKTAAFADPDQVDTAVLYAVHAANALNAARLVSGLETALGSRHDIGLAQGILMERYDLGVDQSFAFLRRLSQMLNRKLRVVAREIIESGAIPTVPTDTSTSEGSPVSEDTPR